MSKYELYTPDRILGEDEYLLKIREYKVSDETATGFLTKLTQKYQIPKAFESWGDITIFGDYTTGTRPLISTTKLPIYVFKETFRSGWKLYRWRFGESQNWASLIHPEGFTVEVKLHKLLETFKVCDVIKGELQGEYMWTYGELIKKDDN